MPEAGGNGAYYVDPSSAEQIAAGMKKISVDEAFANHLKETGWLHALQFTQRKCADEVMKVYGELFN